MSQSHPQPDRNDAPVYQGTIIDQMITQHDQNGIRLILTVRFAAKLINSHDRAAGTTPCEVRECDVVISLPTDNDTTLKISMQNLVRLGFTDEDLTRLHPDHPEAVLFIDRDVCLRSKIVNGNEYWNLAWPRQASRLDEVKEIAAQVQARVAALRVKSPKAPPTTTPKEAA